MWAFGLFLWKCRLSSQNSDENATGLITTRQPHRQRPREETDRSASAKDGHRYVTCIIFIMMCARDQCVKKREKEMKEMLQ